MNTKLAISTVAAALVALPGCKPKETDNPDVAAEYRGNNAYEEDIVDARKRHDYESQGKGIKPSTLNAIEDTILTVYLRDLERCLEDEMGEHETRFLRSMFTVEFHIDTDGQAGSAKVLDIWLKKQNAKGANTEELDAATMQNCIVTNIAEWEFDPAPEVEYIHTYQGQVGEAF